MHPCGRGSPPATPTLQQGSPAAGAPHPFGSPFEVCRLGDGPNTASPQAAPAAAAAPPLTTGAGGEAPLSAAQHPRQNSGAGAVPLAGSGLSIRTCPSASAAVTAAAAPPVATGATLGGSLAPADSEASLPEEGVWGYLQPGRPGLPWALLQGKGVAVGRGKEAYEQRLSLLLLASPPTTPTSSTQTSNTGSSSTTAGAGAQLAGPTQSGFSSTSGSGSRGGGGGSGSGPAGRQRQKASAFVEVADGRVSRLHCWVKRGPAGEPVLEVRCPAAQVVCTQHACAQLVVARQVVARPSCA